MVTYKLALLICMMASTALYGCKKDSDGAGTGGGAPVDEAL